MQAKRNQSKRDASAPGSRSATPGSCATSTDGDRCNCQPSYRAWVYDQREQRRSPQDVLRQRRARRREAVAGRRDQRSGTRQEHRPVARTLREAAEAWLAGAKAEPPTVLNRSGRPYKPSVLRGYEHDLNALRARPSSAALRLSDVRRARPAGARRPARRPGPVRLEGAERCDPAPGRLPARARARRGQRQPDERAAAAERHRPPRTRRVTAARRPNCSPRSPTTLRPIYATAFYAGLRRGELRGLRWDDVDLADGRDPRAPLVGRLRRRDRPPSRRRARARCRSPRCCATISSTLKASTGRDGRDFVFGAAADRPFTPSHIRRQAAKAWEAANKQRAEKKQPPLVPIELH